MATVMGPTPPGTGVSAPATGSTLARSTSPVSLPVSGSRVIPRDQPAFAGGGDQDIGGTGQLRQVDGVRMRNRHGGVVLQQQQRQWTTDQPRAADDGGALAGGIDPLSAQQLENAERSGWDEGGVALRQAAGIVGMETVDIFMWRDLLECGISIETVG